MDYPLVFHHLLLCAKSKLLKRLAPIKSSIRQLEVFSEWIFKHIHALLSTPPEAQKLLSVNTYKIINYLPLTPPLKASYSRMPTKDLTTFRFLVC